MSRYVIRHAKSEANRLTRAAFGKLGASITSEGEEKAAQLKTQLIALGIDPTREHVAVSELQRTQQTAKAAGFNLLTVNELLNEVNTPNLAKTLELISKGQIPKEAIAAAERILKNPPSERVWVTHGLVIAALEVVLGIGQADTLIPDFCEIRELPI